MTLRRVRATIFVVEKPYVSITHSECESVVLVIQHAMRMRHIVLSSVSGCTTFFHISLQKAGFSDTICRI